MYFVNSGVCLLVRKISSAYLLIICKEGKREDVLIDIQRLKVKEIQETVGAYDIIVKIESATWDYLDNFFLKEIRTLPNIQSVMMLHCNKESE